MELRELNRHIKQRNIESVRQIFGKKTADVSALLNTYDESGYTPLMYAVQSHWMDIFVIRFKALRRGDEQFVENDASYILDLTSGAWRVCA